MKIEFNKITSRSLFGIIFLFGACDVFYSNCRHNLFLLFVELLVLTEMRVSGRVSEKNGEATANFV